jgi:hypothetical protein
VTSNLFIRLVIDFSAIKGTGENEISSPSMEEKYWANWNLIPS